MNKIKSFAHTIIAIVFSLFIGKADLAHAYPQFAGDGYFSCTSCHVSTSGGDALTGYGRSFAEEKLATWSFEGEGKPMHGSVSIPEWLLFGGHIRLIQVHFEDSKISQGNFFTMQRELDLGYAGETIKFYATFANERDSAGEYDPKTIAMPKWVARYDLGEKFSFRAGKTAPKFGLNIADHNAYVRRNIGLGTEADEKLVEASYFSETIEVNVSQSAPFLPAKKEPNETDPGSYSNTYANLSYFFLEKQRISASFLRRSKDDSLEQIGAVSAAITPSESIRGLFEYNAGERSISEVKSKIQNSFSQIIFQSFKGFFPNITYHYQTSKSDAEETRGDKIAAGLAWHPRPHFEFSGSFGSVRNLKTYTFGHSGYLMFHYWL
jgi:hypothetical protein